MYYFYYFQDTKTKLYYGGITNNVLKRELQHRHDLKNDKKSTYKNWHLFQDKIQLIVLWIINNYLNPLSLNCSVSNSEYDSSSLNHQKLSELGGGSNAKARYSLEINNPEKIYDFKSSVQAEEFTRVKRGRVSTACKTGKPYNSESGRWLFSEVSIDDLKAKFNNLSETEIKGFILINKLTQEQSQVFYSTLEPQKFGYKISRGNLGQCLLGNRKTVNGHYVSLCI